jgi:hypothetical protein
VLTAAEGGALGHDVARVSSRVLAFAYHLLFHCKNSDISNSNFYIVIILYSEHYYYDLYACTCEFSLHRESFDVILVNTVISRWGCYTWYQSRVEVKCMLISLKNDQPHCCGEDHVSPHKDYNIS